MTTNGAKLEVRSLLVAPSSCSVKATKLGSVPAKACGFELQNKKQLCFTLQRQSEFDLDHLKEVAPGPSIQ